MLGITKVGFKFKAAAIAAGALATLVSVPSSAAQPARTASVGTASLPTYPCAGTCSGTSSQSIAQATGSPNFTGGTLSASFTYNEGCLTIKGQTIPNAITGSANGSITFTSNPALAKRLGTHTGTGNFAWVRTGLTASVKLTNFGFDGGPATHSGTATGIFEPVSQGSCAKPQPLTALVQTVATIN
jgi:hypothetical protein